FVARELLLQLQRLQSRVLDHGERAGALPDLDQRHLVALPRLPVERFTQARVDVVQPLRRKVHADLDVARRLGFVAVLLAAEVEVGDAGVAFVEVEHGWLLVGARRARWLWAQRLRRGRFLAFSFCAKSLWYSAQRASPRAACASDRM